METTSNKMIAMVIKRKKGVGEGEPVWAMSAHSVCSLVFRET